MSLKLRKSVRVGPYVFTLSEGSVRISAGIKGANWGAGPCGNYIHIGPGGIYYRKSPPAGHSSTPAATPVPVATDIPEAPELVENPDALGESPSDPLHEAASPEIAPAEVEVMTDSSAKELLAEIVLKKQKSAFLTWVLLLAPAGLLGLFFVGAPTWALIIWIILSALAALVARYRDSLAKSSVLLYDLDPVIEAAYGKLHEATKALGACRGSWHISPKKRRPKDLSEGIESKATVRRKSGKFRKASPSFVKSNVPAVALSLGRQTLYFLPDRIFLYERSRVSVLGYDELHIATNTVQFIEEGGTPSDTKIVGKTWKYTNKFGEADKRFTNNKEYAICQYEAIHLTTASGLSELLHVSRSGLGDPLHAALRELATALAEADRVSEITDRLLRIAKDGQDLGEYLIATVQEMVSNGTLTLDDYYYDETRNEWHPLRDFAV